MFILIDPKTRKTAKATGASGVTISYYEADGDDCAAYYSHAAHFPPPPKA